MTAKNSSDVQFSLELSFGNVRIPEPASELDIPLKVSCDKLS